MKQLNPGVEQQFSDWQRGLATKGRTIPDSVAERQRELHSVVADGPGAFAAYLRSRLGLTGEEAIDAPTLPSAIGPLEYRDPPLSLERNLHTSWDGLICRRDASRPAFWTLAHIRWLEDGLLGDQIEETFLRGGGRDSTEDQLTRNLLRRVGGLPHVRGKVSVLSDSPIPRAWWRGSVASEIADAAGDDLALDVADIHRVLHSHNDAWARLIGDAIHRITAMNQPRARAALVNHYREASRNGESIRPQEMQRAARLFSRHGMVLALDFVDWEALTGIAEKSVRRAREELEVEAKGKAQVSSKKSPVEVTKVADAETDRPRKGISRLGRIVRLSRS